MEDSALRDVPRLKIGGYSSQHTVVPPTRSVQPMRHATRGTADWKADVRNKASEAGGDIDNFPLPANYWDKKQDARVDGTGSGCYWENITADMLLQNSEPSTALQDSANYAVPWHIVGQFKESVILKVRLCNPAKAATDKFQHVLQLAV